MKIHLLQVPETGMPFAGEESGDFLELPAEGHARAVGPVRYHLEVGRNDQSLWATGSLSLDLELQCARCGEKFIYPLELNDVALQIDLSGPELIDLTPQVREDILLALPAYPHCEWVEGNVCVAQERTSATPNDSAAADADNGAPASSPAWGELDRLNITKPAFPD
jgi:uncharacterized protein